MNTFSDGLRKERAAHDITLQDIAMRTRIDIKYLEAIEQGSFDMLPQTYVRAFLREYAEAVGISPVEVLRNYDIMVTGKYSGSEVKLTGSGYSAGAPSAVAEPPADSVVTTAEELSKKRKSQKTVAFILIGLVFIALTIFVIDFTGGGRTAPPAAETPFQEVVKEQEQQRSSAAAPSKKLDTVAVRADSLVLAGLASDSVWVSVIRDHEPIRTVKIAPRTTHLWKAKEQFIISVTKANAIRFSLEGTDIGPLGTHSGIVKNIPITRSLLKPSRP
jgi:cytoskeletal protein RodZ